MIRAPQRSPLFPSPTLFRSGEPFARHWLHAPMVEYDGTKMSKSLGNLVFISELVKEWDPMAVRLADRKSTRLNSSHANISYAVFCLKKKNPKCVTIVFMLRV